ncbi:MAG: tetratricopeptide repeat protein [Desulforhopalus sp.]
MRVRFSQRHSLTVYKGEIPGPVQVTPSGGDGQNNNETAQAILNLEAEVTANPDNFQNWVRLGHLYFDTSQPEKAIGAYTKALELHSGDANLLTDLGVMYRRAKQPEKAIEQFDLAIKKDPTHVPSRFNKGIVLMYDLGDPEGAIASWEEVLKIDPQAKTSSGETISDIIKQVKEGLKKTDQS